MPKQVLFSTDAVDAITKSLLAAVGDDAEKIALVKKNLSDFIKTGVPAEDAPAGDELDIDKLLSGETETVDVDADPTKDVMLGLHSAVTKIYGADVENKDELVQQAFQKAFETLQTVGAEGLEAAYVAGIQKGKKKPAAQNDDEPEGNEPEGEDEDMEKAMKTASGPVRTLLVALNKRNIEVEKQLKTITDERDAEKLAKRVADAGEPASFVEVLKGIQDPKTVDAILKHAKEKNALIHKGAAFSEIGGGTDPASVGSDAYAQLEAHANEIVSKSAGKTSFAKAFVAACQGHQDLYKQYRADQRRAA